MLELDEDPGRFANLGASFHYHFNYLSFRRAIPHPERVVDSCLQILREGAVRIGLDDVTFKEVDWAYCAHRSLRQSGHRRTEVTAGLRELAGRLYTRLNSPEYRASRTYDDLHLAFGALCAVAELQLALPGEIRTPRPLRLVLDRRPFI
ncbi:hypothetical protein [Occultella kanbiaonis]|uniref:hypothetical protein n=1 Tax=Occultella kanbiaonis TaxID=2675754 RepID=UPI0012B83DB9|nr:hypothetical protein [Occultella kanbiaonis]